MMNNEIDTISMVYPPNRPIFKFEHRTGSISKAFNKQFLNIFLGGTIDMGNSRDWQDIVKKYLFTYFLFSRDITIFNPRRKDFDATQAQSIDNPYFSQQVNWELDYLDLCNVLIFNFEPDSKSMITIGELFRHAGDDKYKKKKIFVCCPDRYCRKGNVEILCQRENIKIYPILAELLIDLSDYIKQWTKENTGTFKNLHKLI